MPPPRQRLEKTNHPQIYKRVNGHGQTTGYVIRPRIKGYKGPSETFGRLTDARARLEEIRVQVRDGRASASHRRTLAEAIDRYLAEEVSRLAGSERRNRERQLAWWRARCGSMMLREIDRGGIQSELRALREAGQKGRPVLLATANRYKAALSAVLSAAVEDWRWIAAHPLRGSGRRKQAKGEREAERERLLTPEEREAFWAACRKSRDRRLYPLVICALETGARQGELMGLEWARVQLRPTVYIPQTGERRPGVPQGEVVDTKNGESRILYFRGEAADMLRELARSPKLSRYVFSGPEDGPSDRPEFPRGPFRYALKRSRVKDFHFHDLRHAWACRLLDEGATLPQLMIQGGWKSPLMVRRYAKRAQREGGAAVVDQSA